MKKSHKNTVSIKRDSTKKEKKTVTYGSYEVFYKLLSVIIPKEPVILLIIAASAGKLHIHTLLDV